MEIQTASLPRTMPPWPFGSCITISAVSTRPLGVTPAMEAGISDDVWTLDELVGLLKNAQRNGSLKEEYA